MLCQRISLDKRYPAKISRFAGRLFLCGRLGMPMRRNPEFLFAVRRAAFLSECESPRSGCADRILQFAQNGKIGNAIYRVCIPVLSAPESLHTSGTVKKVTRKKSLMFKMAGEPLGEGKLFLLIAEEAKKRGLRRRETSG